MLTTEQIYESLEYPPNADQCRAIETLDGPLRIIAGPGSGKTYTLILRTLNLVACQDIPPSSIAAVTFTERAAEELKDRIRLYANRLPEMPRQLAELNVGTIHWFCGVVLRRHHPSMRRFEPLDDLGQQLFIYNKLGKICEGLTSGRTYLGKWNSKSRTVQGLCSWFNKVTEETITAEQLQSQEDAFLQMLGVAYRRYREALRSEGYLDFSFILRELHDLLQADAEARASAQAEYRYFMVDEYQDTNYVQEEVLLTLAAPEHNIAIVGDDDQSLYRFRGATVRNILEFPERLDALGQPVVRETLEINYRSHPQIIDAYLDFMEDGDWTYGDRTFRTGHRVREDPKRSFPDYPAALHLPGSADDLADVIKQLVDRGAVEDASQIALLFYSVSSHGAPVIDALRDRGIDCYAPRAGRFLDHDEVRLAVGVLWALAGFRDDDDRQPDDGPVGDVCAWARACKQELFGRLDAQHVSEWLDEQRRHFEGLQKGEDMAASLLDLFYQSFRYSPFVELLEDPVAARNLAHLTTLVRTFQQQFNVDVLHAGVRRLIPWWMWASFFYLLQQSGVDDVEADEVAPLGMVQVMTIHQAKGLEFPVVVVGSLERRASSGKEIDRKLGGLYPRGSFEPESQVTEFDWRRMFYVAFSRAKHLLITYSNGDPYRFFDGLVQRLPKLADIDLDDLVERLPRDEVVGDEPKPVLSLTGHINVYRRCARQYRFFGEYGFAPSFAAQVFFGTVVHQTIEDIHRHVLDRRPAPLTEEAIDQYFERNSELLRKRGIHPLAPSQREEARRHVRRYFDANREKLDNVIDTEVEVMLEREPYVLNGRVDLIRADDGAIELVDFKAQRRLASGEEFDQYRDQLALYLHLLDEKYGSQPDRGGPLFHRRRRSRGSSGLGRLVRSRHQRGCWSVRSDRSGYILARNFRLTRFPSRDTCRACDFKHFCRRTDLDLDGQAA